MRRKLILLNLAFVAILLLTLFDGWLWIGENYLELLESIGVCCLGILVYVGFMCIPTLLIWVVLDSVSKRKPSNGFARILLGTGIGSLLALFSSFALALILTFSSVFSFPMAVFWWIFLTIAGGILAYFFRTKPHAKPLEIDGNGLAEKQVF